MGDPLPRHHPVHGAGFDPLVGAKAVAVMEAALHQVGHGAKADVGVRADVDALAGQEFRRAHLVEEDEGADHLTLGRRQRAAHLEPAKIAGAGDDDGLDRVDLVTDRDGGVEKRVPHGAVSFDWKGRPAGAGMHPLPAARRLCGGEQG
jgi:hypothetical protein